MCLPIRVLLIHVIPQLNFFADMDGFKLLEHIGLELDLPVISERIFAFPGTDLSQHYGM